MEDDIKRLPQWCQNFNEGSEAQVLELYRTLTKDFENPLYFQQFVISGHPPLNGVLFIPHHDSLEAYDWNAEGKNIKLYLRGQLVADCTHILPQYLRFVKGIFNCSSINVSAQDLRSEAILKNISEAIHAKCLQIFLQLSIDEDMHRKFLGAFLPYLKQGFNEDPSNRRHLAQLFHFQTCSGQDFVGLDQYVLHMPSDQQEIYFASGCTRDDVLSKPSVRKCLSKNHDILCALEPSYDKSLFNQLYEWRGKRFKDVSEEGETAKSANAERIPTESQRAVRTG